MDPHNDHQMEMLQEAQQKSAIRYQCDSCGATVKGPLPGFPVWWQRVSYLWDGTPKHAVCGGEFIKQRQPFRLSGSTQISGIA